MRLCVRCGDPVTRGKSQRCQPCNERLDDVIRRIVELGELTAREVGQEVGLSMSAVEQRISRIRRMLAANGGGE